MNRYVKRYPQAEARALNALHSFQRWPTWMWANWEVVALCEWLRRVNAERAAKVGFYGLDVYSLWESMAVILEYLKKVDPGAMRLALEAYRCFEPYGERAEAYAWNTRMVPDTCEDEVIALLRELHGAQPHEGDPEAAFNAEQNALVMANAEQYYRTMVRSDAQSWNVRDQHMADTLDRLVAHHGADAKAIVWAHNTHIGDARATDMAAAGMVNIGQLTRERHANDGVTVIGFATHHGTVIAGRQWGASMERITVPPARDGSWDDILHRAGAPNKMLLLDEVRHLDAFLAGRGQRAIGVVYTPEYDSLGHYVPTVLPHRYDALLYVDATQALHPLHLPVEGARAPETYPWGV